ncbi:MAG: hypothetical protein IJO60_01355 [Agathobacter sp.]|nr:hypothetical protein [Agathobacter sp.]
MKKILFICLFLILILFSLLYPAQIIEASKQGLLTWFEQILPALLPFTILSTLLLKSNLLKSFTSGGNLLAIGITMCGGFVFGFPIGAKLASDFYKANLLTEKQATILSVTANNFSPMYVCGFVLPTLFANSNLITPTYFFLYFLPLLLAACYLIISFAKEHCNIEKPENEDFQLNMSLLDTSILNGFQTLLKLCGYILLFSIFAIIARIVFPSPTLPLQILLENLEITNGIKLLANSRLSNNFSAQNTYVLTIQLLSFGGLSGIAQTKSIFADSNLSIYKYIIGKVTLSLLLTLLTVIYVSYFNHF